MKALQVLTAQQDNSDTIWALWNLNGTLTTDLLDTQLSQLIEQGFDGFILRPASDIFPHYMSNEFLSIFSHLTTKIEKAGKKFLISDDFSRLAPSIFSTTITQNSSHRAMRLMVEEDVELEEGETYTTTPAIHTPYYLVAVPVVHHNITLEGAQTIAEGTNLSLQEISWTAPEGYWKVIKFVVRYERNRDGDFIANMFSMKGAQSYISSVLDPLVATIEGHGDKAFAGILCELPPLVPSLAGIPWDEELLVSKYRSRFKRNLIETIPALFFDIDDDEAKFRPHIYNFLQDTLYERFPAVIHKWATSAQKEAWFLGPDLDRKSPESSLTPYLSMMPQEYLFTGTTGRDVTTLAEMTYAMHSSRSPRIKGHTALAIASRDTTMASFTIAELKEQLDYLVTLGARRIIIDGFRTNLRYRHEETTPTGISFHHPDFQALKTIITQTRLNILALGAAQVVPTTLAIIAPSQSLLADYSPQNHEVVSTFSHNLSALLEALDAQGTPYTILSETELTECTITADGVLKSDAFNCTFTGVLLLHNRLINNSFFVFLEKFAIKKGLIAFLNGAPIGSFDDGQSKSFADRIQKMVGSKTKRVYSVSIDEAAALAQEVTPPTETIVRDATQQVGLIIRSNSEGDLFLLVNRSNQELSIPLQDESALYEIASDMALYTLNNQNDDTNLLLQAHASVLLYRSAIDIAHSGESSLVSNKNTYRIRLKEEKWIFSPQSLNAFPLTRWNCRLGMNRSRGNLLNYFETRFESELAVSESYLVFIDSTPLSIEHLTEHFKVSLNGKEIVPIRRRIPQEDELSSFFDNDETILIYDISHEIIKGENRLLLLSSGIDGLPNPLAFPPLVSMPNSSEKTPRGWKITKENNSSFNAWSSKGFAHMVGSGHYQHFFEVPPTYSKIVVNFTSISGTALITINDTQLPALVAPPYQVDITTYLNDTRNNLEVTINNSLSPITRLETTGSGIQGEVYLEIFEEEKE